MLFRVANHLINQECSLLSKMLFSTVLLAHSAGGQTVAGNTYAFADFTPSIDSTVLKTFTTVIALVPINSSLTFDSNVFISAVQSFYANEYSGFHSLSVLSAIDAENQTLVTYAVSYNYTIFDASATETSDDDVVEAKIGSLSAVAGGFNTTFKDLYNASSNETSFAFAGNAVCPSVACGTEYTFCVETELGLDVKCRSVCLSTFVCQNNGICVHETRTLSPHCSCPGDAAVWFLGGRCEYKVEVWMIVVFLLGFFGIIFFLILIGCICCRKRKWKPPKEKTLPMQVKKKNEEQIDTVNNASLGRGTVNSRGSRVAEGQEPFTFEHVENDPNRGPVTSAQLATVPELSTDSNELSEDPGFYEETESPPWAEVVEEPSREVHAHTVERTQPAEQTETSGHESSSSSESGNEEELRHEIVPDDNSISGSLVEPPDREYNALQFTDDRPASTEIRRTYDRLGVGHGDRATQTNTRINIELPESILIHQI